MSLKVICNDLASSTGLLMFYNKYIFICTISELVPPFYELGV